MDLVIVLYLVFGFLAFVSIAAAITQGQYDSELWVYAIGFSVILIVPIILWVMHRFFGFFTSPTPTPIRESPKESIDSQMERILVANSAEKKIVTTNPSVSHPKPGILLHPNPENFEEYCTEWCHYLGYLDAVKTQKSRDGGIDIRASNMIAQVKWYASAVGVVPIRELNGVKNPGEEVLFFALNGFTPEARRFASEKDVTLISVQPLAGTIDILA
jgi:hypothetical protein